MKKMLITVLCTILISTICLAQEKEINKLYSEMSGKYALDMGERVVTLFFVFKPHDGKLYFEATDSRSEEMVPVKGKDMAFYTYDPRDNDIEVTFKRGENGIISSCEMTMINNNLTFMAEKDLKYEKHMRADDSADKKSSKVNKKIFEKLGIDFVHVKGGEFKMGDTFGEGGKDEVPVHSVELDDFCLSKTEITFDQFDKFCEETKREKSDDAGWGRGKRPVIYVDFDDATAFCQWLTQKSGVQIRLPYEAEWEFVARESGKNIRFGNGKDVADPTDINFNASESKKKSYSNSGEFRQKTLHVASFAPNALGFYDMAGNVWEWCQDWFDSDFYKQGSQKNPKGPEFRRWYKVIRGGSWNTGPSSLRCTIRARFAPDDKSSRSNYIGFRIVKVK